jgi:hypothetical protein
MREFDDIDQRLDWARLGLSSTPEAKARVRSRLAARGAFSRAGTFANPRHGVPKLVTAALVGVGFATGYWLRGIQVAEPFGERPSVIAQAPATDAPRAPAAEGSSPRASDLPAPTPVRSDGVKPDALVERQVVPPVVSPTPHYEPAVPPSERGPAARHPRELGREEQPSRASASRAAATSGELALLRRAERAIRTGDPTLALILLDQLERDYPRSALGEERAAARILVECARSGELARPEAVRFLAQRPSSVYSDRIIRACRLEVARASESSTEVLSNGH